MDPDVLQDEVDEWVRDDIITEAQADEILARYDTEESRRSRAVLALSLVGAALVFVGVTLFLATNWQNLPRIARAAVLVAGPGLAYAGGVLAYSRNVPRIGLALCILGAVLVGPSLFLFEQLFDLDIATTWLLFAWTVVALPTGHALDSPTGTGLGLLLLVALVVSLVEPGEPIPVVGLLGVVLFAIGHTRTDRVAWTYHVGGAAVTLGALLVLTLLEGRFGVFELELTAPLVAGLGGALGSVGWLSYTGARDGSAWTVTGLFALAGSVAVAALAPGSIPELLAFAGTHLALLVGLLATGYLGYRSRSRSFIDLATLGGLLQTLSFVDAAIIDELSGAVALIVAGLILLAAGAALERGRRSLLSTL